MIISGQKMSDSGSLDTYRKIVTALAQARSASTLDSALKESLAAYLDFTGLTGGAIRVEAPALAGDVSCEISTNGATLCFSNISTDSCICGESLTDENSKVLGAPLLPKTPCYEAGFRSGVCAPIVVGKNFRRNGLFLAVSEKEKLPSKETLAMTELVCHHIGETIERLRESGRAEKRAIDLATVSNIGRLITARITFKEMVKEIVEQLGTVLETDEVNVILYDDEKKELSFLARYFTSGSQSGGPEVRPLSDGINSWIIKNRKPLLMTYDTVDECKKLGIRHGGPPARSWLGAPMKYQDKVVGVLSVQSYKKSGLYDDLSIELLTIVASQCAVAVQNAKLFEEAAWREEEKEKLYFSLTHDLLSLVNPVSGFARLLKSLPDGTSRERYIDLADSMIISSENITRFVEDILVWGKIRSGQLTLNIARADVMGVVHNVVRAHTPELMMRKIEVTVNGLTVREGGVVEDDPVMADFDVAQLERVFMNLIGNAVKHAKSQINLTVGIEKGGVSCKIEDDGDGTPANQLESVFEEFFQAGSKRKGVGLGLPTVKRIVELHHGAIMVDSDLGEGFMIEFSWPRTLADRSLPRDGGAGQ